MLVVETENSRTQIESTHARRDERKNGPNASNGKADMRTNQPVAFSSESRRADGHMFAPIVFIMSVKQVVLCAGTPEGALERMHGATSGFMLPI